MLEKGRAKTVVASRFSVPQNTISTWLKNKDKIMKAYEEGSHQRQLRLNGSTHNNLDKALFKWFVKARDHGIPVGGPLLVITFYSPHFCIPVKLRKRIYLYK